ncbi:MAG: protein kinase [Acidobacteria bacterium]|nr:protein kinase [Acidobacteriota bacterium]
MKCQECNSEISEQDSFCPYCGIVLATVPAVEAEPVPDDLESTVMMSPEEVARLAELEAKKASDLPLDTANEQEPIEETPPQTLENFIPGPTSETVYPTDDKIEPDISAELPDAPLPDILAESGYSTGDMDQAPPADVAEPKVEEPPTVEPAAVEEPLVLNEAPAFSEEATIYQFTPERPQPEAPTPAAEEPPTAVSTEEPKSSFAVEFEIPAEEASVVAESAPVEEEAVEIGWGEEPFEAAPDGESKSSVVAAEPDEEPAPEAEPEPDIRAEHEILKPVEELDLPDSFTGGSIFDSVRIMEPPTLIAPAVNAEDLVEQPAAAEVPASPDDTSEKPASDELAAAGINPTSPNIGGPDTDSKKAAKLKPLSEGTILNGRYEIIRKIGGGGMGAVYLASDNNLGGVLRAVKEMIQAHIEDEQQEKAINDFRRESMILSTLDHAGIPTIFDYFFDQDECRFYLVMKYISGGDLAARLRSAPEGKLDEATVTDWAIQIADVLEYLHSQPSTIVYRDLKPSNIMVDGNTGRVMLIDFGIARSISQREEKGVTAVGTMGYAPPELFSGNVEPRSDIYSLGSTMFHLLTGADPQSNPLLIFDFQKNPRPRQINPRLSDQIETILMKAVEYSAEERFESAAAMKAALEAHLTALSGAKVSYGVSESPTPASLASQYVFCGFCGQRIIASDLFCAFCGARQPIGGPGIQSANYQTGTPTARLFVEGTSELTAPTFSITKDESLLGRRDPMSNIFPEVDLSKYDPQTKISRRHARIWKDAGSFLVEDLGSSNGTVLLVSAKQPMRLVPHRPHALNSGDKIKLGDTVLQFYVG